MNRKLIITLVLVVGILLAIAWYLRFEDKLTGTYLVALLPSEVSQPIFINMLESSDVEFAMWSAYQLGEIGNSEAYMPLVNAINHSTPMVRHNAINAIIQLGQQDLAAIETITIIRNANEESFVIDSALALLSGLHAPKLKVQAIEALKEFASRSKLPWRPQEAMKIIQTLEASN